MFDCLYVPLLEGCHCRLAKCILVFTVAKYIDVYPVRRLKEHRLMIFGCMQLWDGTFGK